MRGIAIAAPPSKPSGGVKRSAYAVCTYPDEDVDDYSDDDIPNLGITQGVRVPRTRHFGGTPNAGAYGRVVQGELFVGGVSQGPVDMSNVVERAPAEVGVEEDDLEAMEAAVHTRIENTPEVPVPGKRKRPRRRRKDRDMDTAEELPPKEKYTTKFVLEGSFGSYRGRCAGVEVTAQFVVILYPFEDVGFSPPVGDQPIKLVCEDEEYIVFFVGCEFPLQGHKVFVQVYIRGTSADLEE